MGRRVCEGPLSFTVNEGRLSFRVKKSDVALADVNGLYV